MRIKRSHTIIFQSVCAVLTVANQMVDIFPTGVRPMVGFLFLAAMGIQAVVAHDRHPTSGDKLKSTRKMRAINEPPVN